MWISMINFKDHGHFVRSSEEVMLQHKEAGT
jgi:hypothetical protein